MPHPDQQPPSSEIYSPVEETLNLYENLLTPPEHPFRFSIILEILKYPKEHPITTFLLHNEAMAKLWSDFKDSKVARIQGKNGATFIKCPATSTKASPEIIIKHQFPLSSLSICMHKQAAQEVFRWPNLIKQDVFTLVAAHHSYFPEHQRPDFRPLIKFGLQHFPQGIGFESHVDHNGSSNNPGIYFRTSQGYSNRLHPHASKWRLLSPPPKSNLTGSKFYVFGRVSDAEQ